MTTYLFIGGKQNTQTFEISDDLNKVYFANVGTREQEEYRKVAMFKDGQTFHVFGLASLSDESIFTLYANFINPQAPTEKDKLDALIKKLDGEPTGLYQYQREWLSQTKKETR